MYKGPAGDLHFFVYANIVICSVALFPVVEAKAVEPDLGALPDVEVVGKRFSLSNAQELKREKLEIVDSVVAEEIHKLPDYNVTDALSRVTGVQILRDRGEGAGVAIRGLTQMETLFNGREIFTAGNGRNLDFSDIPAEMLAGLDVYKTASVNLIEGGVGGTVDLRTHRPFDFEKRQLVGSARGIYGDLTDEAKPQLSALASDRWRLDGWGEVGALVNFSWQERAWREDQKSAGSPSVRSDIIPGRSVVVARGTTESASLGHRERLAGNAVLQWRPTDTLELYAEANYAQFKTFQDTYQVNAGASENLVPGSARLFAGTNDVESIAWLNAPVSVLGFARDTVDRTFQAAVGGSWRKDKLAMKTDLSHTISYNNLFFSGPELKTTAARFDQTFSGDIPSTQISGSDLLDAGNYQVTSIAYRTRPFRGDLSAIRFDVDYDLDVGWLKSLTAGYRYAKRHADNEPGLIFADAKLDGISAADRAGYFAVNPLNRYLGGQGNSIGPYLSGNVDTFRNFADLRQAFGITAPIPSSGDPLGIWHIEEQTHAGYLMGRFEGGSVPLDGNLGLRIVATDEAVFGSQALSIGGTQNKVIRPIALNSHDMDYLPSLNLRYRWRDDLFLRAGLSKSLTRQNFDQLSPALSLLQYQASPWLNSGSAGNPALKPIRSDNLDIAIEKYFNATTSIFLTGFIKRVEGFTFSRSGPEVHGGVTYQVSRPQNSGQAGIRGLEAGYQQFYDFLPDGLKGLGLQANYTFVDSEMDVTGTGEKVPLQNLSRHSYNLVGLYERGPFSLRIAYNWRDRFLSGITQVVGVGALPAYTRAYGWLDASLRYRINGQVSVSLEGLNLLNTLRSSYYGVETRPQSVWVNDTQVAAGVTVRF